MPAIIKQLKQKRRNLDGTIASETTVYPVTRTNAVYLTNGFTTLDQALADLGESGMTIRFNPDGSIEREMASGNTITTVFKANSDIEETCVDEKGRTIYVKTTKFNADGSIVVDLRQEEG